MEEERQDGRRIVIESDCFLAAYPSSRAGLTRCTSGPGATSASLLEFERGEQRDLARVLKTLLQKYDQLCGLFDART